MSPVRRDLTELLRLAGPVILTRLEGGKTPMQPVSALQAREGRDVLVAAGAEPFADAVLGLLGDAGRRREVGEAGRRYVESHHRWTNIAAQLESIYRDVAADAAAGRRLRTA